MCFSSWLSPRWTWRSATNLCTQCMYEDKGCLCDVCARSHACGEEMLLQKVSHHLLLRPSVGQGQKKFLMAYLPKSGKLSDNESLRTMNLTARLQTYTVSHVKPYGVLFVLLVATHRHV